MKALKDIAGAVGILLLFLFICLDGLYRMGSRAVGYKTQRI